jgi:predicted nucleic acid-binding protein
MSYEFVVDSYAWIEYFRGTPSGAKARRHIEGDSAATSAITLAELREKYLREKWGFFQEDLNFISTRTSLAPVDRSIALLAGEIDHAQKKLSKDWSMADSIILATARSASAKAVTGDPHFEGLPEAELV